MSILLHISQSVTSLNFITFIYFVYIYIYVSTYLCWQICSGTHVEIGGQQEEVVSCLPPWGSWEPNKIIGLDLKKKPCLFIEPSYWSTVIIFLNFFFNSCNFGKNTLKFNPLSKILHTHGHNPLNLKFHLCR